MSSATSALGWPCCLMGAGRLVRKIKIGENLQDWAQDLCCSQRSKTFEFPGAAAESLEGWGIVYVEMHVGIEEAFKITQSGGP